MKQPRGKRVSIDRENGWLYALQPLDQTRLPTPKLQCKSEQPRWDRPDIDCEPQQAWGVPRNLQLDETGGRWCPVRMKVAEFGVSLRGWLRSSDIGCGFEDPGLVRPEDCFSVPSLSVVRGGASASPAGREFEIAY